MSKSHINYHVAAQSRQIEVFGQYFDRVFPKLDVIEKKNCINNRSVYSFQKADPTQFLQVHGRKCKIHLEASVAAAAENPAIMQVIFRKQNTCFCSTYNYILTHLYDCPTSDALPVVTPFRYIKLRSLTTAIVRVGPYFLAKTSSLLSGITIPVEENRV